MNYDKVDLNRLTLDPSNPRLPTRLRGASDESIVNWMLSDASLIELMTAIGTNGFFPGEPLLVVEDNGSLIVVEGNRRLASLMLLNRLVKPTVQVGVVEQALRVTNDKEPPKSIPVIQFDDRNEIEKYLGFRHVTGVKEWSPLAKARYLKSLMNSEIDTTSTFEEYRTLARQIGSNRPYVQRLIVSYNLYELLERKQFFNIPGLKEESFYFTYLMDSLNRAEIKDFLDIDFEETNELKNLNLNNFQQLIEWFFLRKSNGRTTMNASSSQLSMLCDILEDKEALSFFLKERDLNSAHEKTVNKSDSYRDSIERAEEALKEALINIAMLEDERATDLEQLDRIDKYVNNLSKQMAERLKS
ncbi:TPA: hypothetical protein I7292_17535 [Vibrio parahaemolyticus]|nr:hypothetical protein [Vibrio parahaemolyticus]